MGYEHWKRADSGKRYYSFDLFDGVYDLQDGRSNWDDALYDMGLYFTSPTFAQKQYNKIFFDIELRRFADDCNRETPIDWSDSSQCKYYLYISGEDNKVRIGYSFDHNAGVPYFTDEDDAVRALAEYGEQFLSIYGEQEEEE